MDPQPRDLVALAMLAWASVSDLRTRRVPNLHWWPFVVVAAAFLASDLASPAPPWREAGMAALVALLAYALYRLHLFGGADAKCLMVLAFLLPGPGTPQELGLPPAVTVLLNASLAALAIPVAFLLLNGVRGDLRVPAMLLGVRMDVREARERHVWPLQRAEGGRVVWRYWQRIGHGLEDAYDRLEAAGVRRAWVTPKVPFMVPLLLGLVVRMVWGNALLALAGFGLDA